jgi:hypothetical protein
METSMNNRIRFYALLGIAIIQLFVLVFYALNRTTTPPSTDSFMIFIVALVAWTLIINLDSRLRKLEEKNKN